MRPTKAALSRFKDRKVAAKHYDVNEKTIIRWQRYYGLYQPRKNYGRKLDATKAEKIRMLYFGEKQAIEEIAEQFGVTIASVYRIINNQTYKEVRVYCGGSADVKVVYNTAFCPPKSKPQPCAKVEVIRSRTSAKT